MEAPFHCFISSLKNTMMEANALPVMSATSAVPALTERLLVDVMSASNQVSDSAVCKTRDDERVDDQPYAGCTKK